MSLGILDASRDVALRYTEGEGGGTIGLVGLATLGREVYRRNGLRSLGCYAIHPDSIEKRSALVLDVDVIRAHLGEHRSKHIDTTGDGASG